MKQEKEKKIIFSEEIDSSISGFSLVITFIIVGLFLLFNKDYFENQTVSKVIQWIFIVMGCLGFGTEISKMNKDKGIRGIDDLIVGVILVGIWAVIYYFVGYWIGNVIGFLILIMGVYGSSQGIIKIIYSFTLISKNHINNKTGKLHFIKEIILILSEILGIALIVVQILQAVKII